MADCGCVHERGIKRVERHLLLVERELADRRECGVRDDEEMLARLLAQIEKRAAELRAAA